VSGELRLFHALPLPEPALEPLLDAQARARPVAGHLGPRFTSREQLHVTLKFLGSLPAEQVPRLHAITATRARAASPFEATAARVTAFGGRRARVLVVELETASPVLLELARGLEDDVAELGVPRETRAFRPHVTLARFKQPGDARAVIEAAKLEPFTLSCGELRLYRSELGPNGSRYSVLSAVPLGGE
jgi:2'-5' RNA ligase